MPSMCANNCGFFSGANTEGLCSFCFKEAFPEAAKEQARVEAAAKVSKESNRRGTGRRAAKAEQSSDLENNVKVLTYSTVEYGGVVSRVVMVGNNTTSAKQPATVRRPRRTEEEREAVKAKRREDRKVLKAAFASMLILIAATISIFGLVPGCILFTTSVSFFFHSRQQRIKRKAEKQGGGGEEEATEVEKAGKAAKALEKEEEVEKAADTGIEPEQKKAKKVRCKVDEVGDPIQSNKIHQNIFVFSSTWLDSSSPSYRSAPKSWASLGSVAGFIKTPSIFFLCIFHTYVNNLANIAFF